LAIYSQFLKKGWLGMYYLYLLGANMLRILTNVFFLKKNLVSKFWRNLTITLAILVEFTLQKTESDFFFPNFFVEKMAKACQEKKTKALFLTELVFFLRCFGVCPLLA
jgi:hypothetical protein